MNASATIKPEAILIVECQHDVCRQIGTTNANRNVYGFREWVAPFHTEIQDDVKKYVPDDGESAYICPNCGESDSTVVYCY